MGLGDEVMATGLARNAAARGRLIAFGDGNRLRWGQHCEQIFRYNPNIARSVGPNVEWIKFYKGSRFHAKSGNGRWLWNYDFKPTAGEFYFDDAEKAFAIRRPGEVLIEPNVEWWKTVAPNKDWGIDRWQSLVDKLRLVDVRVWQNEYGKLRLAGVNVIKQKTYRQAVASLSGFDLAIVPEGGLHHAAAAVDTPAIVIFGGFTPPQVTGYESQINLTGGAEACGSWKACAHCRQALRNISVEEVYELAINKLHAEVNVASCCCRC